MTKRNTRITPGEPGAGATHPRAESSDAEPSETEDDVLGDGHAESRGTDDDRPIDVAPRTGPFEMGSAEAGFDPDTVPDR